MHDGKEVNPNPFALFTNHPLKPLELSLINMFKIIRTLVIWMMASLAGISFASTAQPGMHSALGAWVSGATKERLDAQTATRYVREAYKAAKRWGVDPLLLLAVMNAESNYRERIGNRYGAKGLMQVVPRFHRDKIAKRDILSYKTNIDVGAQIIDEYMTTQKNNFPRAMRKYSGGARAAYHQKIASSYEQMRAVAYSWVMENHYPFTAEYRYGDPRRFMLSQAGKESAPARVPSASPTHQERLKEQDAIYEVYLLAMGGPTEVQP